MTNPFFISILTCQRHFLWTKRSVFFTWTRHTPQAKVLPVFFFLEPCGTMLYIYTSSAHFSNLHICMSDDLNSSGRRLTVLFPKLHGPHTNHKHWPTKDVNNCRATYMYMLYTLVKLFTSNRQQFIGKSRVKNVNKRTGHVHASGWPYECATCDWSNAIWAAKANNMS